MLPVWGTSSVGRRGISVSSPYGKLVFALVVCRRRAYCMGNQSCWLAWHTGRLPSRPGSVFLRTRSMLPVQQIIPAGNCGIQEGCPLVQEACFCTGVVFGKDTPFEVSKKQKGEGWVGVLLKPTSIACQLVFQMGWASPASARRRPPLHAIARHRRLPLHPLAPAAAHILGPWPPVHVLALCARSQRTKTFFELTGPARN